MRAGFVQIVTGRGAGTTAAREVWRGLTGLVPAMPVAVVLAIILIQCLPAAQAALQFDRRAVCAGQVWRLLTCHLTHWSWFHLAADLAAFVVLYWLVACYRHTAGWRLQAERNKVKRSSWVAVPKSSSAFGTHYPPGIKAPTSFAALRLKVPPSINYPCPGYRPFSVFAFVAASAVTVGLAVHFGAGDITVYRGLSGVNYALLGWVLVRSACGAGRLTRIGCAGLLVLITAKIALEVAGAGVIPAIVLPEGIAVVGVAHAAGLTVGILTAMSRRKRNA